MNPRLIECLGSIFAQQAKIQGMIAANEACKIRGTIPKYGEESFNMKAEVLSYWANQAEKENKDERKS